MCYVRALHPAAGLAPDPGNSLRPHTAGSAHPVNPLVPQNQLDGTVQDNSSALAHPGAHNPTVKELDPSGGARQHPLNLIVEEKHQLAGTIHPMLSYGLSRQLQVCFLSQVE